MGIMLRQNDQRSLRCVPRGTGRTRAQRSRQGSALLIVLVLLGIMAALVAGNAVRLDLLKREM
ncbi:MAG: hypothetical protein L0Z50_32920, partial [Verrucomicrobiales bacterium]|nr:hypothetical protein [Verrucomicrobiales bacterium]